MIVKRPEALLLILRLTILLVRIRIVKSSVKSAESYHSCIAAIKGCPAVGNVTYRQGVHKIYIVIQIETCGLVRIVDMNNRTLLSALESSSFRVDT